MAHGSTTPAAAAAGALVFVLALLHGPTPASAHGYLSVPKSRNWQARLPPFDGNTEYCPHCKSAGGVGTVQSLWPTYTYPETVASSARHGLCGDPAGDNQRYLASGDIVARYTEGSTITVEITVTTHHRGHFELFLCDMETVEGNVVTQECLMKHPLKRDPTDTWISPPDDRAGYEGRYYIEPACARTTTDAEYATSLDNSPHFNLQQGQKIRARYMLPDNVTCDHCVLQWWWITGNSCLAPGYRDRMWPSTFADCSGDGPGAGWWGSSLSDCGKSYPEEFWNCADIAIDGANGQQQQLPPPPPSPVTPPPTAPQQSPPPPAPLPTQSPPPPSPSSPSSPPQSPSSESRPDFGEALRLALLFYDAQRTGALPADVKARVSWRKDSFLNDGSDVGLDLSGGYFDAGDMVKYGFPAASAMTMLAWGVVDFSAGFDAATHAHMLDTLKWFADYAMRAHPSDNLFYGQVGNTNIDHSDFCRPEECTGARPAYSCTPERPCSDLAAETAAALAATAMAWQSTDSAYAGTLLEHATSLYTFAETHKGRYHQSITDAAQTYPSTGYMDELGWGAAWLHRATGEQGYLTKAESYASGTYGAEQSWDSKDPGLVVLLHGITGGRATYRNRFASVMNNWLPGGSVKYTPQGLAWLRQWGPNRYAANMVFVSAAFAAQLDASDALAVSYRAWGLSQLDYMLGNNDNDYSYLIGYGNNYPRQPHHKSSVCAPAPAECSWGVYSDISNDNHFELLGGLVGGPGSDDVYVDDRTDYVMAEVALDYNAGFTSAVAAFNVLYPSGQTAPTASTPAPPPTTRPPTQPPTTMAPPPPPLTASPTAPAPTAPSSASGTGGSITTAIGNSWRRGCQLKVIFEFPITVTSWTLELTLSPTPTSADVFQGVGTLVNGVLVVQNAAWNGNRNAGDVLQTGMVLRGTSDGQCFTLLAANLNGIDLMDDGASATESEDTAGSSSIAPAPATTAAPTTTAPTTTAPTTAAPTAAPQIGVCGSGTSLVNGICVAELSCGQGTARFGNTCVPDCDDLRRRSIDCKHCDDVADPASASDGKHRRALPTEGANSSSSSGSGGSGSSAATIAAACAGLVTLAAVVAVVVAVRRRSRGRQTISGA